jgi:hypothetical protein
MRVRPKSVLSGPLGVVAKQGQIAANYVTSIRRAMVSSVGKNNALETEVPPDAGLGNRVGEGFSIGAADDPALPEEKNFDK